MSVFHLAVLFGAALLLVCAAISDARHYRIPNRVCLGLLLLFPLFVLTAPGVIEWEQNLMVFGLMLLSGFIMFMGNVAGAGDIKLLAATGLWVGPHLIAVFLIVTAIAGGFVALVMALLTYMRNRSGHTAIVLARVPIPYGIAISIGGLGTFYMLSQSILLPS